MAVANADVEAEPVVVAISVNGFERAPGHGRPPRH